MSASAERNDLMERWYRVPDVAEILGCSTDTARARMAEMPEVINVGSKKRRQLMVPQHGLDDWLRNHRMDHRTEYRPEPAMKQVRIPKSTSGRMARMDRRTGKLVAV